jgi:hypothetical protein
MDPLLLLAVATRARELEAQAPPSVRLVCVECHPPTRVPSFSAYGVRFCCAPELWPGEFEAVFAADVTPAKEGE